MTIGQKSIRLNLPSILVLGGGRWARVVVDALLAITTDKTPVLMASPAGGEELVRWIAAARLDDRVAVIDKTQVTLRPGSAVIVANSAHSHVESTLWALEQARAVLVEKPFAPTIYDVQRLMEVAAKYDVLLAPALVFRFAPYLDHFASILEGLGSIERVELIWTDPAAEYRHGELKRYDPGVSVIEDCLPHVASLFAAAFGSAPDLKSLEVERGGARVKLDLLAGSQSYDVLLERNATSRRRILRAFGPWGGLELDFTAEPISMRLNGLSLPTSPSADEDRPLTAMLRAFLRAATGEAIDSRLSVAPALFAAALTEISLVRYRQAVIASVNGGLVGPDLAYAVAELLQRPGRLDTESLELASAELQRRLACSGPFSEWDQLEAMACEVRRLVAGSETAH